MGHKAPGTELPRAEKPGSKLTTEPDLEFDSVPPGIVTRAPGLVLFWKDYSRLLSFQPQSD